MTIDIMTAEKFYNLAQKNGVKIERIEPVLTLVKFFEAGNMAQYSEAESAVNFIYNVPVNKSESSTWGTTGDGVGGFVGCKNGHMRINRSGVKRKFIKELKAIIEKETPR